MKKKKKINGCFNSSTTIAVCISNTRNTKTPNAYMFSFLRRLQPLFSMSAIENTAKKIKAPGPLIGTHKYEERSYVLT